MTDKRLEAAQDAGSLTCRQVMTGLFVSMMIFAGCVFLSAAALMLMR